MLFEFPPQEAEGYCASVGGLAAVSGPQSMGRVGHGEWCIVESGPRHLQCIPALVERTNSIVHGVSPGDFPRTEAITPIQHQRWCTKSDADQYRVVHRAQPHLGMLAYLSTPWPSPEM